MHVKMKNVKCLFIKPETRSVGELHRQFSIKDFADMLVIDKHISDLFMTYVHQLNFSDAHQYISHMTFSKDKISSQKTLELNIDDIINVPLKMLMSPIQAMSALAYYSKREDPYILSMDPLILPFDIDEDPELCGWTIQEHSTDI